MFSFEHVKFHYRPLSIVLVRNTFSHLSDGFMPIINESEIPTDVSYQSMACFQEVICDDSNRHILIYFGIVEQHFGE